MALAVLPLVAGLLVLPVAALFHPGRSRVLAIASVLLALLPFYRAGVGLLDLSDALLPFPEAWKVWVARVLAVLLLCGLAFLLSTVRIESWWPAFVALALAGLLLPDPLAIAAGAAVAATALGPILRGGFGDPLRWRRIGAFVALLALAAANGLLLREALIP